RAYRRGDAEGFVLVFAAANNPAVHREIFEDAALHRIPVNVADVPDLCSFYLGSVFQNGDLKVAVSTNGKSPTLGKIIRDRIAAEFGKGYPELLDRLGEIRPYVHSAFSEPEKRKEVLEKIVDDELSKGLLAEKKGYFQSEKTESLESQTSNLEPASSGQKCGKVILVGAGPGDPELISVKGLRAIQSADVIAYDALVSPELLSSASAHCDKIFVGKRSGSHYALPQRGFQQEEINKILIARAREGKNVLRLKGGDPFVFGRGGEELQALREEGVDVEIIPGITAGTGIPSSLGIPLTHRGVASSVVFVTGSEISEKENGVDWGAISAIGTIVVYMGIKKLLEISEKLLMSGRSPETPAAVIFGGTTPEQLMVEGTLETIAEKTELVNSDAPGIIIVGEVVKFFAEHHNQAFELFLQKS
ncbi:MAG: uroporphyrinogen-III C-methyltransferase, partial [Bacteroidota bacterium]|nr:uroporphyrinogen-III C-methyltransferase [Bacteroidota bacterium]